MLILLPFVLALLAYYFNKTIRLYSILFYIFAVVISALSISFSDYDFFNIITSGQLGLAFIILVMYVGAFPRGSKIKKQLRSVRREYAILGFIFISPHALLSIYDVFFRFVPLEIFGVIGYVLLSILALTSFQMVKQTMKTSNWLRLHRLAYTLYILIYIHMMVLADFPSALVYTLIFGVYLFLKLYNYAFNKRKLVYSFLVTTVTISGIAMLTYDMYDYNYEYYDIVSGSEFEDGTYIGTAIGYKRKTTKVSVTIKNNVITNITLISVGATPTVNDGYYLDSAYDVANEIVKYNRTDIDVVSGATDTSISVNEAVIDALEKAKK